MQQIKSFIILSLLVFALVLIKEKTHAHSKKSLHAHSHGAAELSLAVEGQTVEVEFKSPNHDILGFEHEPKSKTELDLVEQIKKEFNSTSDIFTLNSEAECKILERKVDFDFPNKNEDHAHSDFEYEVDFSCLKPENLKTFETSLFKRFPTLAKIQLQIATAKTQKSEELNPKKTKVNLN